MKAIICDTVNQQVLEILDCTDPRVAEITVQPFRSVMLVPDNVAEQAASDIVFEYSHHTDTYLPAFPRKRQTIASIPVTTVSSNNTSTDDEGAFL